MKKLSVLAISLGLSVNAFALDQTSTEQVQTSPAEIAHCSELIEVTQARNTEAALTMYENALNQHQRKVAFDAGAEVFHMQDQDAAMRAFVDFQKTNAAFFEGVSPIAVTAACVKALEEGEDLALNEVLWYRWIVSNDHVANGVLWLPLTTGEMKASTQEMAAHTVMEAIGKEQARQDAAAESVEGE